jgi:hypothetical protein
VTIRTGGPFRNILLVAVMLVSAGQASLLRAQEEAVEGEGHEVDNAVALFLGGVTHLGSDGEPDESGFGIGLEYARLVTSRLSIGLLAEYASTGAERDFIAALPLFGHLTERLLLVAAPGVEFASEEGHEEGEASFLMRFGTLYEIVVDKWVFAPQVHADVVSGRWTLVYGISFGMGF